MNKIATIVVVLLGAILLGSCNKDEVNAAQLEGKWTLNKQEYLFEGKTVAIQERKGTWLFYQGNLQQSTGMPWPYVVAGDTITWGTVKYHIDKLNNSSLILSETPKLKDLPEEDELHRYFETEVWTSADSTRTIFIFCNDYHYHNDDGSIVAVNYIDDDSLGKIWYEKERYYFTR